MARLVLESHQTRDQEVVDILISLGGKILSAEFSPRFNNKYCYFINDRGYIEIREKTQIENVCEITEDIFKTYSLEEFENYYPYKENDEVKLDPITVHDINDVILQGKIKGLRWDSGLCTILYEIEGLDLWVFPNNILRKEKEFKKNDCFVSWNSDSKWLYVLKIQDIDLNSEKSELIQLDLNLSDEEWNLFKISETAKTNIKLGSLFELRKFLEMTPHENDEDNLFKWVRLDLNSDFEKLESIIKDLEIIIKKLKTVGERVGN